jgi:hypothetical protein
MTRGELSYKHPSHSCYITVDRYTTLNTCHAHSDACHRVLALQWNAVVSTRDIVFDNSSEPRLHTTRGSEQHSVTQQTKRR